MNTVTWTGIVTSMISLLEENNKTSKAFARRELMKMATRLDKVYEYEREPAHDPEHDPKKDQHWLSTFGTEDKLMEEMGYDTILGWLAKEASNYLRGLDDPINDTIRDGYSCTRSAGLQGYEAIKVTSPEIMQQAGLLTVNAYPVEIIHARFKYKGAVA